MIVLDTNVVSEMQRPRADAHVTAWLVSHQPHGLWVTATVIAEMAQGICALPHGRRRLALQDGLDLLLADEFADKVLAFDTDAARAYGHVFEVRKRLGRPIQVADAQIAAVCLVHDAALATRNVDDFAGLGLDLIDPWHS